MPRWTEESRAKQREVIMKAKPWEKTTGPKTVEGKARACANSYKHGFRSKEARELSVLLGNQAHYRSAVEADVFFCLTE